MASSIMQLMLEQLILFLLQLALHCNQDQSQTMARFQLSSVSSRHICSCQNTAFKEDIEREEEATSSKHPIGVPVIHCCTGRTQPALRKTALLQTLSLKQYYHDLKGLCVGL